MREWQTKLPESQRKVLQEIVEQIPTNFGVRDAIEDVLDNLARGGPKDLEQTPEMAYEVYRIAMERQGTSIGDFGDLDPAETHAWGVIANSMRPMKYRFFVFNSIGGEVTGLNDEEKAHALCEDEDLYIVDTVMNTWLQADGDEDDIGEHM